MSTTVQEFFNNVGYNKYPEITRLSQLTFTGDSNSIVYGTITLGDTGLGNFLDMTTTTEGLKFSFSDPRGYSLTHIMLGAGSKRVITYNLDKKLLVVADITPFDTSATYPAYLCSPRVSIIKSATSFVYYGRNSRDRYLDNQGCATQYGNFFNATNSLNTNSLTNSARKTAVGDISLQSHFVMTFPPTSGYFPNVQQIRIDDGIYLADGDIGGMTEDTGRIISDGTKSYICCGYRLWMDYE